MPYADVGPIKVPAGLSDEQVLFLSDIFPTGYMAADFCDIQQGDTIAIWGCGPVGQMAIRSAFLLGAERVIAIDTVPERLELARAAGAITIDFLDEDVYDRIQELTKGRGADACIDAVGTEPLANSSFYAMVDRVKVATFMGTDRPHVLRQAIHCTRNFGTVSIVGVYGGFLDKIPFGSAINRGLTMRMAQTPVQGYLPKLLEPISRTATSTRPLSLPTRRASKKGRTSTRCSMTRRTAASKSSSSPDAEQLYAETSRPLAIVTGASSGIGLELAKLAVDQGYDLIIAADEPEIDEAAVTLETDGA